MVFTRKFSEFVGQNVDDVVGLTNGENSIGPNGGGGGGSGDIIVIIDQDTTGLDVGDWVRINNVGLYVPAIATSAEEAEVEGVVLEILSPTQFKLQQSGYIHSGTPGFDSFVFNGVYFLSDTSLGDQTQTQPTTNGYVSKPVFAADSADSGWVICLMRGVIIGTPGPIPSSGGGGTDTNIHTVTQPGHGFMIGDWIKVKPGDLPNLYELADGTSLAQAQSVGVVINVNGDDFTIQFAGYNTNTVTQAYDSLGVLIPGGIVASTVYYISDVKFGQLTPTPPSANGTASRPAFISESALNGTGWVLPQRPLPNAAAEANPIFKTITQPGHGFTYIGLIVKPMTGVGNQGKYEAACANTFTTSYGVGMISSIPDINTFTIQEVGYITGLDVPPNPPIPGGIANPAAPFLAPAKLGIPFYLTDNPLQAGQMFTAEPVTPNFSKPIFMPDGDGAGWILPMKPTIGHGGGGGGGGAIVQAIAYFDDVIHNVSYNNAAYAPIPYITGTITPSSITNKIRITICVTVNQQYSSFYALFRNGSRLPDVGHLNWYAGPTNGAATGESLKTLTFMFIDSPASIALLTYNLRIITSNPVGLVTAFFNNNGVGVPAVTSWTLEEIEV